MTKIEIEAEVFGDWAFPADFYCTYYQGVRTNLSAQQTLFLLTLARSGDTMTTMELVARVSPGASEKLGHVLACNIAKKLSAYGIEPPFDNMYERSGPKGPRDRRQGRALSGYKWIG